MSNICVFGLGKLGATLVGVLADAGHFVRGYDPLTDAVVAINSQSTLVFEPGLEDLLRDNSSRISGSTDPSAALEGAEVVYIIVPTPSQHDGSFDNKFVREALSDIAQHLASQSHFLTIVIASTVMPGSCVGEFIPLLEEISGKSVGKDFGLVYSPEFIALGSIVRDMHFPDMVLIGESDSYSGDIATGLAGTVVKNEPVVRRMSLPSAELTKLAVNTFVTTKISYANMLSELCDRIPGANIDDVTEAVGSDSRVGQRFLRAGLGYGGPCFPRDNMALSIAAETRGVRAEIARATDSINNRQVERVLSMVEKNTRPHDLVGIIGIAYKARTPVTEKSQALEIGRRLVSANRSVIGFDPLVSQSTDKNADFGFTVSGDFADLKDASVLLIANPEIELLPEISQDPEVKIIDLWGAVRISRSNTVRPGREETSRGGSRGI